MALTPGSRCGPYEILGLIGKGGMGEVYRAHDTQLDREVAIKALPEEFAGDSDRLSRFEREAKLLASLNHPNIAAIYGLESSHESRFLILELIEGETLAERIEAGPIPVEETLKIALHIAEALEAAHDRGVIHRDLKPGNIKITPEGKAKVLDFGLAKAFAGSDSSSTLSNSPTLTMNMTQQGVILGTAAYMAPEQARGKKVDHRSDIWSFGCVVYEMLTGHRVFQGEEVSDILASVLARDPDFTKLESRLHPGVRKLLLRCLDKDPRNRWQAAGDVRFEIQELLKEPTEVSARLEASPTVRRSWIPWTAALVLVATVAAAAGWMLRIPAPTAVTRFDYDLPGSQVFRNAGRPVFGFSPDGRRFAYNTATGIFLRELDQLEARLIAGTEGAATSPTFSPDGQWLVYFDVASLKLTKIAISGGAAIPLTQSSNPFGVSWEADGTILYGQPAGIYRVSENGGMSELLFKAQDREALYGPQLLPGGDWVLFTSTKVSGSKRWDQAEIVAQSLKTQERVVVWRGGSDARYVPTGHLLYALDDGLFAVPFDADSLKVTGGAVSVAEDVLRAAVPANNTAAANYNVSRNGSLAYVEGFGQAGGALRSLVWVDRRTMREEKVSAEARGYAYPRISPDGSRVALDDRLDNDIQVWDFAAKTLTRLTFGMELEAYPTWTLGGDRIAYSQTPDIFWKAANNTGSSTKLVEGLGGSFTEMDPYFFSPDGSQIVFRALSLGSEDIGMMSMKPGSKVEWLLRSQFNERNAELSPDGKWMAYQSDETGDWEIYVQPFPDVEAGRWQISNGSGMYPRWSKNSNELFYAQTGGTPAMMAAQFTTSRDFVLGTRVKLFDVSAYFVAGPAGRPYDVGSDGRFLMLKTQATSEEGTPPPVIIVVENWFDELRKKALK
ncbi:MAG TPA: protein kinase [Terriglobia bacterium]|nr:protein kinase [Terriglobia bacterium]